MKFSHSEKAFRCCELTWLFPPNATFFQYKFFQQGFSFFFTAVINTRDKGGNFDEYAVYL